MTDSETADIYVSKLHPLDSQRLEQMTAPKSWDYDRFKRILVSLAMVGSGQSIPARNRPDRIDIQGWRPFIEDLKKRTKSNGKEHVRVVLADTGKKTLIMSGKISVGTSTQGRLHLSLQPGREAYQTPIASLHTHPVESFLKTEHGLSGQDYKGFLKDPRQQAMLIGYGDNLIMVMKTSVTPNNLPHESINRRIEDCEQDYLGDLRENPWQKVVDFNKAVCSEMGLTMYLGPKEGGSLMGRVGVTSD